MYTLFFPFELAPEQKISGLKYTEQLGNIVYSLQGNDRLYELNISGFPDQQAAEQYINVLWAGLMWVLLNQGVSFKADLNFQQVIYTEYPYQAAENIPKNSSISAQEKLDGIICNRQPVVFPSDKKVIMLYGSVGNVFTTIPVTNIFQFLIEGVSLPYSSEVIESPKLKTALELYATHFIENSLNAKFLTLVMVLEALSIKKFRPNYTKQIIEKWMREAVDIQQSLEPDSEDYIAIAALIKDVNFRKYDSIRSQIRSLVYDTLTGNGDTDAADVARKTLKIYDQRSKLVHDGKLPDQELRNAIIEVKNIVERVLKAQFIKITKVVVN